MRVQLICNDEEAIRALRLLLSEVVGEFEVTGVSRSSPEGIARVGEARPDIVILDLDGVAENRLDTIRTLFRPLPAIQVLVRGAYMDRDTIERVLQAGALGVFGSGDGDGQLIQTLRKIRSGQIDLSNSNYSEQGTDGRLDDLTQRERQVLEGLADGRSSKEVAHDLGISSKTVDTHRRNVMHKLEISGIANLVKYAIRAGLTTLETPKNNDDHTGSQ